MINVAHVPLQLNGLLPDQFECRVRRRLQPAWNPWNGIDRLLLREKAELEVGSDGLLSGPIVEEGVMDLPVNVILNAGEVGHMLHLTLLLDLLYSKLLLLLFGRWDHWLVSWLIFLLLSIFRHLTGIFLLVGVEDGIFVTVRLDDLTAVALLGGRLLWLLRLIISWCWWDKLNWCLLSNVILPFWVCYSLWGLSMVFRCNFCSLPTF